MSNQYFKMTTKKTIKKTKTKALEGLDVSS